MNIMKDGLVAVRSPPPSSESASNNAQASAAFCNALVSMAYPALARHCRRVADLSRSFGRFILMSEAFQEELYFAALYHDIGLLRSLSSGELASVMVPRSFRLDESYQGHAEEGARLVGLLPELSRGAGWIRHHHERCDGDGYPAGLRGNSIPLGSRIISLADTYDQYCFEEGISPGGAVNRLLSDSGLAFDPLLVERFAVFAAC